MGTILSLFEPCTSKEVLPYTADEINSVMIDFVMGQLPEQCLLSESEEFYESSGEMHSVDMFLHVFGEPMITKRFGDNYLFYYHLQDKKTLVITINAFAYDINRIQINHYVAC